jgi:hypothetical protein
MFMSETTTNICPSCSELGHGQGSHEGNSGCDCGKPFYYQQLL